MKSLRGAVVLVALACSAAALGTQALAQHWGAGGGVSLVLALAVATAVGGLAAGAVLAPLQALSSALDTLVLSWREGDFGPQLTRDTRWRELQPLALAYQQLAQTIRAERQQLAQREWLLDTLVQHTPVALLLLSEADEVLVANLAARQLLADGRRLQGLHLSELLQAAPAGVAELLSSRAEGLVQLGSDPEGDRWLVSQRLLLLQGLPLRLVLLRPLTQELARQEVAAWKRVLRVLSHELNNSLAPMQSMAHSGAELARRADEAQLAEVFERIEARSRHLHAFLAGYAHFAKLPAPQRAPLDWGPWLARLQALQPFAFDGSVPTTPGWVDAAQFEQALLNLLKNAHESGSAATEVQLRLRCEGAHWQLSVADRGPGASDAVLTQALLPFYSTKRGGTGLGLALAREVIEAHGGRLSLGRRSQGGLRATLHWPV